MNMLRIAYFGTPQFSADFLEKILTDKDLPIEVAFVVTQPDRRVGREQVLTPTPVKVIAQKYNIPILDVGIIEALRGIDLAVLYAYGEILPPEVLEAPKRGFLNIHLSLLPRYRGVSPTAFPIILGDNYSGVSLMKIDNKIDHGPLYAQARFKIDPKMDRSLLEGRLTALAFDLFPTVLKRWGSGHLSEQDDAQATYTIKLHKNHGFLPFDLVKRLIKHEEIIPADLPQLIAEYCVKNNLSLPKPSPLFFYNLFRGLHPWPGLWTFVQIKNEQKRLKLTEISFDNNHFSIQKVQLEGKKEVDFKTFMKAYPILARLYFKK